MENFQEACSERHRDYLGGSVLLYCIRRTVWEEGGAKSKGSRHLYSQQGIPTAVFSKAPWRDLGSEGGSARDMV